MAVIVTKAGKGDLLTNAEVDSNFTNLNDEVGSKVSTATYNSDMNTINDALAGRELTIPAGSATQFLAGDKTWKSPEDASVTLTDAPASDTLPATSSFKNVLQTVRNGLKDIFSKLSTIQSDLSGKASASHSHSSATGSVAGFMSAADKSKLDGVSAGATANATDAQLRDRASHTGTQAISTVSGLQGALDAKASDADVVNLTNAQTVGGTKTFTTRSSHAGAYTPANLPAHSSAPTFNCAASNVFEPAALTSMVTSITLSDPVAGQTVQIRFQQDGVGGRTVAVPSGAKVDGAINTAANRVSWLVLTYSSRGARWEGNWLQVPA